MTSERAETIKSFDGTDLFFRCFTPKQNSRKEKKIDGLVLAVHGFGEHSGRYAEVAEVVCGQGMAFACFDLRGHGKSGPRRGDAENLHALVLDVLHVVNHARGLLGIAHKPDIFYGLLGHSFGGLLVTYAASILNTSCPPIFLSSPCYTVRQKVPAWKKAVARTIPGFLPTLPVPLEINPDFISENPENNQAYVADELNLSTISARYGEIFLGAVNVNLVKNAIGLIRAPVRVVCGKKDKLTDTDVARDCVAGFTPGQATLAFIDEAGHEIFNERLPQKQKAFEALRLWIQERGAAK